MNFLLISMAAITTTEAVTRAQKARMHRKVVYKTRFLLSWAQVHDYKEPSVTQWRGTISVQVAKIFTTGRNREVWNFVII